MGSFSKVAFSNSLRLFGKAHAPTPIESVPTPLDAIELEPRVLYSATPLDVANASEPDFNPELEFASLDEALLSNNAAPTDFAFSITEEQNSSLEFVIDQSELFASLDTGDGFSLDGPKQLVFIDSNVEDWQQLLVELSADSINQNISIVVLDANRGGIEQISETLAQKTEVDAIHLISHGNDNQLNLGTTALTSQNLLAYAGEIAGWSGALADGADFLIYGCDLASSDSGRDLIGSLGALCDCDVAASDDLTGHESLGGDWILETEVGEVTTDLVFSTSLQNTWLSVLTVTPDSGNFVINDSTSDIQKNVDAIIQDDGSSVAVFDSLNDGSGEGVYFRMIDASGTPTGTDVLVNQTTLNRQVDPAIARDGAGNFVVTWTSTQSGSMDVYARMFDSSGGALTGEILVNSTSTIGEQHDSAVAMDDAGNFVVTWEGLGNDPVKGADGKGIWARRYFSSGSPNGGMFLVHDTVTATTEDNAAVAMDSDGDFVITWTDRDGGNPEIHAQRFDSSANPLGQFFVQATLDGEADLSSVAMDDAGNFVVVWGEKNADPSQYGVKMRSFTAAGTPQSGDVLVNTTTAVDQLDPDISMDSDGDYVISWTSTDQDGDARGVIARAYFADGTPDGGEIGPVNTYTTSDQHVSNIALNDSGQFIVVWEGESAADSAGVYGRLYDWPDAVIATPAIDYSTFLGGSFGESVSSAVVHSSGDVFIVGRTQSADMPTTLGALDKTFSGASDLYVARISPDGNGSADLVYLTYVGGSGHEFGGSIQVDAAGNAFVAGATQSADLTTTAGAYDTTLGGTQDSFVVKIDPTGTTLLYGTYFGGDGGSESGPDLVIDAAGRAHISGQTHSADLPLMNAVDSTKNGSDSYIARLSADGSALEYSTYIGGSGNDSGGNIAVDASGLIYFANYTLSTDFQTTAGAYQTTLNGTQDAVLAIIDPSLGPSGLLYSTYFGGSGDEGFSDVEVDSSGNVYLLASTDSADLPTTVGAYDTSLAGADDLAIVKFNPAGNGSSDLLYSTYIGGTGDEDAGNIVLDGENDVVFIGSSEDGFPIVDAVQGTHAGGADDAIIGRLSLDAAGNSDLQFASYLGGTSEDKGYNIAVNSNGDIYVIGRTNSADFPTTVGAFDTTANGDYDNFVTKLTGVAAAIANNSPTDISPDSMSVDENIDTSTGYSVGTLTTTDPDVGETFTYTILAGVDGVFFSIGGGSLDELVLTNGTLDFESKDTYTVNVQVEDSTGNTYSEMLTVDVNDLNEVPVVNDQAFPIDENAGDGTVVGNIAAADLDAGLNGNLTFNLTGGTGFTAFAVDSSGQITVADTAQLDFETTNSFTLDVEVTDGGIPGLTDTATITINLNDLNEVPIVNNQAFPVNENAGNGTVVGNIAASDLDAGVNGNLSFNLTGGTGFTAFAVDSAGQITVADTAQLDFETSTSFTLDVEVTDGGTPGLTDSATITINLADVNDAPVIGTNQLTITEGNTVTLSNANFLSKDAETPDSTLVYTVSNVLGGQFEFNAASGVAIFSFTQQQITDGDVDFVDNGDEFAPSYDVAVSDGSQVDGPEAATITFTNVDDAPVIGTNQLTIAKGTTVTLSNVNFVSTDAETPDPTLVYTVSNVLGGQFEFNAAPGVAIFSFTQQQVDDGDVDFVDNGDEIAPSYDVAVSDGSQVDGPDAATITFTNVDDAPVIGTNQLTINEGTTVTLSNANFLSTDAETSDPTLVYAVSSVLGGRFEFNAAPGVAIFSFTQQQITDGDVDFVDNGDEFAPSYDVAVSDGSLVDGPEAATITFTNVDDDPVIGTNQLTITEGTTVMLSNANFLSTDAETSDPTLVYIVSNVVGGQFEFNAAPGAAIFSFTQQQITDGDVDFVDFGDEFAPSLDVAVSDGSLVDGPEAATITFSNVDDAPVIGTNQLTITEGTTVTLSNANFLSTDAETSDPTLVYTVSNVLGGQFEFNAAPGAAIFSFTQAQITAGDVDFVDDGDAIAPSYDVAVSDGSLVDGPEAATITFFIANDAPVIGTNQLTISEATTVTLSNANFLSTDAETPDPTLVYTVSSVLGGQFEFNAAPGAAIFSFTQQQITDGDVDFVDNGDEFAPSYDVAVNDGSLVDGPEAATITYTGVNDAPVLGNNLLVIDEGTTVAITAAELGAADIDNPDPSLTFAVSSVVGGQFELTTAPGVAVTSFTQADVTANLVVFVDDGDEFAPSYDVSAGDGSLIDGPDAAAINFGNVNDAPVGGDDAYSVDPNTTLNGTGLLDNDTDVDDPVLTSVLDTLPANGTVVVNADGSFVYTPNPTFSGTDSFTYLVNDGTTNSAPTTVVVNVNVAIPPTVTVPTPEPPPVEVEEELEDPAPPVVTTTPEPPDVVEDPIGPTLVKVSTGDNLSVFTLPSTEVEVLDAKPEFIWLDLSTENKDTSSPSLIRSALVGFDQGFLDKSGWFWEALDSTKLRMESEANLPQILLGTSAAVTSSVTVGYLVWLVKGGQVAAALAANLPAWQLIDPLPILNRLIDKDDEDDDSLESIIEQGEDQLETS